jgi:hypothetical protein
MKRAITTQEQKRINELLNARKAKVNSVPKKQYSKDEDICRMLQYEYDNSICDGKNAGMTYLEVEQFNNTYNNF